jgi:hypothetical protein
MTVQYWIKGATTSFIKMQEMLAKLKGYCGKHGDCLVPFRYKEDPTLEIWRV